MARGGWRWNAGRPPTKGMAEDCLSIDARWCQREGRLASGATGALTWRSGCEVTGQIGATSDGTGLLLAYTLDGTPMRQRIKVLNTPCTYGGARPWFGCPTCGARVAILYMRLGRFQCRACARVAYRSQSEDECGRSWLRQQKAEARLLGRWMRPKGMHHATHERLKKIILDCVMLREDVVDDYMARHPGLLG